MNPDGSAVKQMCRSACERFHQLFCTSQVIASEVDNSFRFKSGDSLAECAGLFL
jgi:hypothetical protein